MTTLVEEANRHLDKIPSEQCQYSCELIVKLRDALVASEAEVITPENFIAICKEYDKAPENSEWGVGRPIFRLAEENDMLKAAHKTIKATTAKECIEILEAEPDLPSSTSVQQGYVGCVRDKVRLIRQKFGVSD